MARRKKAALDVPASEEEAITLVASYSADDRETVRLRLIADEMIAGIKEERDRQMAEIEARQKLRFAQLKAWWEAAGHQIAKGGRRSAELAGTTLGIRLSPPRVKLGKGLKDSAMVATLKGLRWTRVKDFLRTKVELDKPAIIKAVQAEEEVKVKFANHGLTVVQVDEFFIDTGIDEDAIRKELTAAG